MKIDNIKDAKPGDILTVELTGEFWDYDAHGGGDEFMLIEPNGTNLVDTAARILSIERPAPKLPTEPGSIITNVTLNDGRRFQMLVHDGSRTALHWVFYREGSSDWVYEQDIASFTPAKVVPA